MNTNAANSSSDAGVDGTALANLSLSSPTAKTSPDTRNRTTGETSVNIGSPKQDFNQQENPTHFQKSGRDQGSSSGGHPAHRGRFPRRSYGHGGRQQSSHPFSTPPAGQLAQSEDTHSGPSSVPGSHKYTVRRRQPPKADKIKPNDVYISLKTSYKAHCEKCIKLLDGKFSEIHLRALSDAIPVAINVAVELKKFFQGTVDFTTRTETINLIDDLIPTDDATAPTFARRKISAIDIHVFRTINIP